MISFVICDDIIEHAVYTEQLIVNSVPDVEKYSIDKFLKADELLKSIISEKCRPDIAILDIAMPDIDGIKLAEKIHELLPECKIIFLTNFAMYASAVYRQDHIWFILKNSAEEYMPEAIAKAINLVQSNVNTGIIMIRTRGNIKHIPVEDVLYIERNRHSSLIFVKGTKYTVSTHPEILIENCSDCFIRCHQSYWVNIKAIKELDKTMFILIDDTKIDISRTYRNSARSRFFEQKIR